MIPSSPIAPIQTGSQHTEIFSPTKRIRNSGTKKKGATPEETEAGKREKEAVGETRDLEGRVIPSEMYLEPGGLLVLALVSHTHRDKEAGVGGDQGHKSLQKNTSPHPKAASV